MRVLTIEQIRHVTWVGDMYEDAEIFDAIEDFIVREDTSMDLKKEALFHFFEGAQKATAWKRESSAVTEQDVQDFITDSLIHGIMEN